MTSSCGQATPSADHPQVGTPSPLVLQLLLITEVYEVAHKGTSLQQTQQQTVGADFGRSSTAGAAAVVRDSCGFFLGLP